MTGNEMILEFKVMVDKLDTQSAPDLYPETILLILNEAMDRLVKSKYSGNNIHNLGFEEWQKRTDDLKNLVKRGYIKSEAYDTNAVSFNLNSIYSDASLSSSPTQDYQFFLRTLLHLTSGSKSKFVGPKLVQIDDLNEALNDPFNAPSVSRPLIAFEDSKLIAFIPEGVTVDKARLTYLKRPNRIVKTEQCELSEHVHKEIVQLAITIALETIESQRVETQPQLLNTQE